VLCRVEGRDWFLLGGGWQVRLCTSSTKTALRVLIIVPHTAAGAGQVWGQWQGMN